ncbi:hypothetical protein ASG58_21225 [Rhizobium sp. Leaf383]|nr:hypothetical protein ASG58_21225 [Rhizobium sp. Leaf383]
MKHRRGIDLGRAAGDQIKYLGPLLDPDRTTFADIPEWHTLGGHCSKCEREAWLVRWDVARKWGNNTYRGSLASRMRCIACGNRAGNKWILGQLPR